MMRNYIRNDRITFDSIAVYILFTKKAAQRLGTFSQFRRLSWSIHASRRIVRFGRATIIDPIKNQEASGPETKAPVRILHIAIWILQIFLASVFGFKGYLKVTEPMGALSEWMPWVFSMPEAMVRFIGVSELAAAFGLILPSLFRIQAQLSAQAAACLSLVMAAAAVFHISRNEINGLPQVIFLGLLSAIVAWGRFDRAKIDSR